MWLACLPCGFAVLYATHARSLSQGPAGVWLRKRFPVLASWFVFFCVRASLAWTVGITGSMLIDISRAWLCLAVLHGSV